MTIVVSDTSPIRALDFLELLPVLEALFGHVLIPPAVQDELVSPLPRFEAVDLSRYNFIEVRAPLDKNQIDQLLYTLDRGESEAIALALEVGAQLILMDEKGGRKTAVQHGVVPQHFPRCLGRLDGHRLFGAT